MPLTYFAAKQKLMDEIVRLVRERPDLTYQQIGELIGAPRDVVKYRAKLAGLKRPNGRIPKSVKSAVR
jgi:hypothetical protein